MSRVQFTSAKQDGDVFTNSKKGDLIFTTDSEQNILFGPKGTNVKSIMVVNKDAVDIDRPFKSKGDIVTDSNVIINTPGLLGVGVETPMEKVHIDGNCLITGSNYVQGRIGINTTNPEEDLDVNGSVKIRDEFFLLSDKRKKENIRPVENALNKTHALQGVSYTRNDIQDKEKTFLGFIAQDVEKVIPEAVNYNAKIDEYSLNYVDFIAVCVEAIKDLSKKVDTLQERLDAKQ
eukprot:1138245-Pelagomonas_calceolata.AAC.18